MESSPQDTILSLARVIGPLSPTSTDRFEKDPPANPYQILQVRRDATAMEIRQSYRRLALWHHPGRKHAFEDSQQGRQRRYQSFTLLAACYETLINGDSRRRYDNICREVEQLKLQAGVRGAMFVGGKPLLRVSSCESPEKTMTLGGDASATKQSLFRDRGRTGEFDQVPLLSRASSGSSTDGDDAQRGEMDEIQSSCGTNISFKQSSVGSTPSRKVGNCRSVRAATVTTNRSLVAVPASLVDATSSEEDEEPETHFTESTTRRLFGGPLSHLFKARNFEPFSDPYDVFENVFGSDVFPRVSRQEIGYGDDNMCQSLDPQGATPMSPSSPRSPAAWKGECHTSPDGKTTIFLTSRVLHDRRLTRIETVKKVAPGKTQTHLSVTSEPLTPEHAAEGGSTPTLQDCLMCNLPTKSSTDHPDSSPIVDPGMEASQQTLCSDLVELYENVVNEMGCTRSEFCEEWNKLFSYSTPFKLTSVYL